MENEILREAVEYGRDFHRAWHSVAKQVRQSFNGKVQDELLNREWFRSRARAKVLA